jgi:large subunit ribosomal protein L15
MTVNKRKKNTRQRGSKTHGYGSMKKHRGFGSKGGKGRAGSGKRADSKKPTIWNKKYFGKYGFKSKNTKTVKAVNLVYLEENLNSMLLKENIKEDNGVYIVDLAQLGFNKLLSQGKVTTKFRIVTEYASKKAVEKIKAAGGEVIISTELKEN